MQLVLGVAACVLGVAVIARAYRPRSKSGLPLPPSPPNWRLMGHFLPPRNSFLTVAEWINEYGPVITIRAGTEKVVIIGRHKAAVEIMEKQGRVLADRPPMNAGQMITGGLAIGFTGVGDKFRRMRRAIHTHLQPKAAEAYQPMQMSFAKNTVLNVLDDPSDFQNHVISYAMTTILTVAYGKDTPTSATDPEVRAIRQYMSVFRTVLSPGAYWVDTIPWLKYLPWYGRNLKREFESSRKIFVSQMNRLKQQSQSNVDAGPSFGRYVLENERLIGLSESEAHFLPGTFFAAGGDSSTAAICTVLMAAACFPEEQAKVQAELDEVVGRHRAPTFADQQSLPLLDAFISEALRWRTLSPNGFPHRTTQDVIWENYCIPAGTTVLGSNWAISRDPEVYPDPDVFKPQRWMNDQGGLRDDLTFFVYGYGRRICPALHLANRSVWINSALLFWAFQLTLDPTKPLDDVGFIHVAMPHVSCPIVFTPRVPDAELRRIMRIYPEVDTE
ncbi:cytochrome P450 [Suillus fuscotomentosus]|uniref:Cytochrome P450 n=1 Tax=Suillus fuscotomentosus TaxID=1912939 RepID=A0AAD4EDF2_9AGAM|nr:cytochrome P450 [Suillus fuscotomentosus]KAG1903962.1 cytochrome P450 [Suillus fuscotomentosus]